MSARRSLDRRRGLAAAAAVIACLACSGAEGSSPLPGPPLHSVGKEDSLSALGRPAAFAGRIPCDDCDGIDLVLILHPDGSYRAQERYAGKGRQPGPAMAVGRWTLRTDSGTQLILHGGGDPARRFDVVSQLRLRALDSSGRAMDSTTARDLRRISVPEAFATAFHGRGTFRYYADAANLVECVSGRQFPVTGDSAYLRLEAAHGVHALGHGASIVVDVSGHLQVLPGAEEGTRLETFVVDSHTVAGPTARCDAARTRAVLAVGDWEMTALDGVPLPDLAAAVRPTLRFLLGDAAMTGNAGCNRFTGHAVLRGLDLVPRPVALTRLACADSTVMAREGRYSQILAEGGWFRLDARDLVLSHGGHERARFRRR
ncbi:MAG: META domain-containing protein [Gemmatimonadaceae bacterium]